MRPRLQVIDGGRKDKAKTVRPRGFAVVRRKNERGEAVYLTAIMTAPHWIGGGPCA